MKSRVNREVQARFCERFGGEIPPYLLDHFSFYYFFIFAALSFCPWVGFVGSFAIFGLCYGWCELQMCQQMRWLPLFKVKHPINFNYSSSSFSVKPHKTIFNFITPLICNSKTASLGNIN